MHGDCRKSQEQSYKNTYKVLQMEIILNKIHFHLVLFDAYISI